MKLMEKGIEVVREHLTPLQRETLISKLEKKGFQVGSEELGGLSGDHVIPIIIKKGHPSIEGIFLPVGFLPVGYLKSGAAELVNTDLKFPKNYHRQLRRIYNSV